MISSRKTFFLSYLIWIEYAFGFPRSTSRTLEYLDKPTIHSSLGGCQSGSINIDHSLYWFTGNIQSEMTIIEQFSLRVVESVDYGAVMCRSSVMCCANRLSLSPRSALWISSTASSMSPFSTKILKRLTKSASFSSPIR